MVLNDLEIFNQKAIAESFNKFFNEIGPKLGSKILHSVISFEDFLRGAYPSLEEEPITYETLKTLRTKKSFGYDEISSDVIKHILPSIFEPMSIYF